MEDQEKMSSTILSKREASDSSSSNSPPQKKPKRPHRQHGLSSSSSKYKGVVPQQNGNWGAQIYANHQRIWLGTFKTEAEAASAYDSAAIKLRRPGPTSSSTDPGHRNFPWTPLNYIYEPKFQAHYTIEQVLNMIKDGSYQTKFGEYLASISQVSGGSNCCQTNPNHLNNSAQNGKKEGYFCQELFRKELTPSDVGKLNRLVIPKRYALKYFPKMDPNGTIQKVDSSLGQGLGDNGEDMELIFYDKSMRSWKFRYCYWKSSQSFVFTRGWNKFVKDKDLKAKDIVAFYTCELRENNGKEVRKFCMIDIVVGCNEGLSESPKNSDTRSEEVIDRENMARVEEEEKASLHEGEEIPLNKREEEKGIRLFGVHIYSHK